MKTLEQWIDNYASETLHSWGLKGYTNLLDELKEALMFAVKEAPRMPEQPKPRYDAQGRLLASQYDGELYYFIDKDGAVESCLWSFVAFNNGRLAVGNAFISQPAAEAELTRLKCLQRLRGMEGFDPLGEHDACLEIHSVNGDYYFHHHVIKGFDNRINRDAAEATITPEERAAFLYREPTKE
jgi:hypothetical protein